MSAFPLVDRYVSILLDLDLAGLAPGKVAVGESPRRLRREQSYGFVHAAWGVWLEDGRAALSVPPGAGAAARALVRNLAGPEELCGAELAAHLQGPVSAALEQAGLAGVERAQNHLWHACGGAVPERTEPGGAVLRLREAGLPCAEGLSLPTHCFPDGKVYGVEAGGKIVAVAYAHRTGLMEDRVADVGVETAPAFRRRGYARMAVAALVNEMAREGGEALYSCAPANLASQRTALSVGFVPYGVAAVWVAPWQEATGG